MYNNIMENCLALEKHIIENLDYLNWFIINRFYSLKKKKTKTYILVGF